MDFFTTPESSNITGYSYDGDTNDMIIVFNYSPQLEYVYHNVPEHILDGITATDSVGTYHNEYIKKAFGWTKRDRTVGLS